MAIASGPTLWMLQVGWVVESCWVALGAAGAFCLITKRVRGGAFDCERHVKYMR